MKCCSFFKNCWSRCTTKSKKAETPTTTIAYTDPLIKSPSMEESIIGDWFNTSSGETYMAVKEDLPPVFIVKGLPPLIVKRG